MWHLKLFALVSETKLSEKQVLEGSKDYPIDEGRIMRVWKEQM
jgi:hypothetical protein